MRKITALFAGAGFFLGTVASFLAHKWQVGLLISLSLGCLSMTWLIPYYAREISKKKQREEILRKYAPPDRKGKQ